MGTIYKSGIPYSGGSGGEYTAGDGIKIENGVISGTKVGVSKGATNIIEVEGINASKLGFEFGEDVVLSASSPMLFGESVALQKKLTAGDNITIENNTISADDEVFVAVYEQTSYADVKDAIDAHKAIVLDMPANNNQFCITFATYTNGGNALMYAIYKMSDQPTLMTVTLTPQSQWTITHTDLQDKLISGTNIKTINNTSLLGSGNIDIDDVFLVTYNEYNSGPSSTPYADIYQALIDEKDILFRLSHSPNQRYQPSFFCLGPNEEVIMRFLMAKNFVEYKVGSDETWTKTVLRTFADVDDLESKQDTLVSGTNIKTINNTSLLGDGNIDIQGGIDLEIGEEKWYGTYTEAGVTYQVYSKVLKIDALPATAGITNYPHGITGIKQILCAYGFGTNGFVLNAPRQNAQDNIAIYQVQKASGGSVAIEVGKDRSNMGAYVCLVYAKNN